METEAIWKFLLKKHTNSKLRILKEKQDIRVLFFRYSSPHRHGCSCNEFALIKCFIKHVTVAIHQTQPAIRCRIAPRPKQPASIHYVSLMERSSATPIPVMVYQVHSIYSFGKFPVITKLEKCALFQVPKAVRAHKAHTTSFFSLVLVFCLHRQWQVILQAACINAGKKP